MRIEKPIRVRRSWTQRYRHSADAVFPLLCPVREADWVPEWDPLLVVTESGQVEIGCLFVTEDAGTASTWVTTKHDRERRQVAFVKVTPGIAVAEIEIAVTAEGSGCRAEVTYAWTALGEAGRSFVESRDETYWQAFMQEWERELAAYLDGTAAGTGGS